MSAEGVIHDIGYRRYDGVRLGRLAIVRALIWHSLRAAFGLGRGAKAKVVPVLTFVLMCLPAVVSAIAIALSSGHQRQVPYDTYLAPLRILVMMIFVAAQAPELVSRDLRSRILPLYLARPISRADYPAAKLAAFIRGLPRDDRDPVAAALPRVRSPRSAARPRSGRRRRRCCQACCSA